MAGLNFRAIIPETLTTTAALTLIRLKAPANQRVLIRGFGISFKGVTAPDPPIKVDLLRQTTDGTGSALTLNKADPGYAETIQTAAIQTVTVEPTAGEILWTREIHPQGGGIDKDFAFDRPIIIPGGGRVGLRVTAATTSINCEAWIDCEE